MEDFLKMFVFFSLFQSSATNIKLFLLLKAYVYGCSVS